VSENTVCLSFGMVLLSSILAVPFLSLFSFKGPGVHFLSSGLFMKPFGNKAGWIYQPRLWLVKGLAEQIADAGEGFG